MKKIAKNHSYSTFSAFLFFAVLGCIVSSCHFQLPADGISGASIQMAANGNSLFYQKDSHRMQAGKLEIAGEIKNPGMVDLEKLYTREIVLKEMINRSGQDEFMGAYRYIGYSLHDLLHEHLLDKKNSEAFRPATDVYIIVENAAGDQVSFSWSEIFHSSQPHQAMIAVAMAPIVPFKKEVQYPVVQYWRLVSGGDLYAERQLENPVRINVVSFDKKEYPINRDIEPLYSKDIKIYQGVELLGEIGESDHEQYAQAHYSTCFYGMGMGYHPAADGFTGPSMEAMLQQMIQLNDPDLLRNGLVCFVGLDGYRAVYSLSELFNRNDQIAPIFAVNTSEGGLYRNFLSTDFYADRSVKSLQEVYFFVP